MFISRHQNAGQIHNVKIANTYLRKVAEFVYLGVSVTNHEEFKSR